MIITDEQIGFVFIKVRGNDILMEWLKKTMKHGYQCIRPVGPRDFDYKFDRSRILRGIRLRILPNFGCLRGFLE